MSENTLINDGPQKSPDGVGFKTKPKKVIRVSRTAAGIFGLVILCAVLAIIFGILSRKQKQFEPDNSENVSAKLSPASQAGENISRDIPEGNMPVLHSKDQAVDNSQASPGKINIDNSAIDVNNGTAAPLPQNGQVNVDPEIERVRRLREEREKRLRDAMDASTTAQGAGSGGMSFSSSAATGAPIASPGTALQTLYAMANQNGANREPIASSSILAGIGGGQREEDQNMQAQKQQFLRNMEMVKEQNYVSSTRKGQTSPYEIKAGWLIPAAMNHGINSDLPGQLTATVTQDVYDSATGKHLLIPQGATIIGGYDSQIAYGQEGLLVGWPRLIFPDGSSINLGSMGGSDQSGYAGFRDEINNHYGRLIGFGVLTSLFSAAFQVTQNSNANSGPYSQPSAAQTAGSAVAQQMTQLGIEVSRKNLRIQPTATIRPGYLFNVRVEKDLIFPRPYVYGNAN